MSFLVFIVYSVGFERITNTDDPTNIKMLTITTPSVTKLAPLNKIANTTVTDELAPNAASVLQFIFNVMNKTTQIVSKINVINNPFVIELL